MPEPPRIPRATYRLQLNAGFTLADAEAVVPYLDELGVSHLYLSSFVAARPGSSHGYDVIDHNSLNPELGDEDDLARLAAALRRRGMGIILDFVPNHMGIGGKDNAAWLDVLEWGQASAYGDYFDIDWEPSRRELRGKVLVPFLGDHYGAVLERGELVPRFDRVEGSISVWYWEHRYPIRPEDYARLLRPAAGGGGGEEFDAILQSFRGLATGRRTARAAATRRSQAAETKARLAALVARRPALAESIDAALRKVSGTPGEPASFAPLHKLLERQHYRLSYWRVAADEINYRRFFDINDLASLRMERPNVFDATHRLVLRLLKDGTIQGLRIDHIDGLYNPAQYCQRLQRRAAEALGRDDGQPIYLLVEKILAHHERLRRDWPVAGTTGYEFMNLVNALFVDGDNAGLMDRLYTHLIPDATGFDENVRDAKLLMMRGDMSSELYVLTSRLGRIAQSHWRSRDFTLSGLREALAEIIAFFPIYRTYVTRRRVTDQDRRYVEWAVAQARKWGGGDPAIYGFVGAAMDTSLARGRKSFYSRSQVLDFAMSLQQYTGPVMAKGYEDTALYRYNRLISLNEVGGDPRRFGISPTAFHLANANRLRSHPHSMLATATHDAKRGEDVRARIDVLSEITDEWRQHLARWMRLNQPFKRALATGEAPAANDELFLYQTMLGAWPTGGDETETAAFVERLCEIAVKGVREAKLRTSWSRPDEEYEQAVQDFLRRITEGGRRNPFLDGFLAVQERLARVGLVNGLSQTLLKLTAPGVPDIYQGAELWQLALVDPDNRRPVDYELRRRLLERARQEELPALLETWRDGAVKLGLIWRTLALRRSFPDLFAAGGYQPLQVRGERAGHVCAFARVRGDHLLIVAVPLLVARLWPEDQQSPPLGAVWRGVNIDLPRGGDGRHFVNVLTGDAVNPRRPRRGNPVLATADLFSRFPVALLESRPGG